MAKTLTPQQTAERSLITTYRKTLWKPFIAAVKRYELVSPGDRIAVCVSGGKDSAVLAKLMQELQRHTDRPFYLSFLVMNPGYRPENMQLIRDNAERLGIPITVFENNFLMLSFGSKRTRAICAPVCAGGFCTKRRVSWAVRKSRWGTICRT